MNEQRRIKLVNSGGDQVVTIPRDLALPGDEATVRREGERLIIEGANKIARPLTLFEYLDSIEPIDEEFPEIGDPYPEPVDL